jgi:Ca-activated chloride channel family protein
MNFIHMNYLPGLALGFIVIAFLVLMLEKRFFTMVKRYWFYNRSFFSYLSTLFFLAGTAGLLISLLDLRGPEEKIKTPVPEQRTIILIDTSASMLAEDVRPSRLQKAALIAKHFARKAAGQQISIVAFAEIQKKIVPFTTDLDLLDARLDSLKTLRNQYGSSALSMAIQESIQYFKESGENVQGNVLVLTDGEETAEGIKLKIPQEVKVALVGIGTTQGGRIPLDDGRGFRYGYKKNAGVDVITKLNENFFKSTVSDIPNAKYWLANSYSLPTEDILDFFKSQAQKGSAVQDMVMRPVLAQWIVVPAILAFILSYLLKAIRIFAVVAFLTVGLAHAQEAPQISPELQQRIQTLGRGELSRLEKIKLADDLYKAGGKEEALTLYEENMPFPQIDKTIPPEAYMNYGSALLENKQELKGLTVYQTLKDSLPDADPKSRELNDTMEKNVVTHFKQKEQKKQQQKKDQQNKDQQDQNNQNKSGEQQPDGKPQSGQQDQSGQQQKPQDKKDKGQEQKDKEKKDQQGDKSDEQDRDDQKEKDQENPGDEQKKIQARKKVDPKLKQLMDDDRQLQIKLIENGTRDLNRRNSRKSKDW